VRKLGAIVEEIRKIVAKLEEIKSALATERRIGARFITASEFMQSVKIGRWKFDQLIRLNKIKTIKKERKIYVLATEVERYFMDSDIR
jgi:hypothetical protein